MLYDNEKNNVNNDLKPKSIWLAFYFNDSVTKD